MSAAESTNATDTCSGPRAGCKPAPTASSFPLHSFVIPVKTGIQGRGVERMAYDTGCAAKVAAAQVYHEKRETGGEGMKQPCVYMLASTRNGTLYVGVTSNLVGRVWQHKQDLVDGFTRDHGVHRLVWYEPHETMESAILAEKRMKKWNRRWKVELIEKSNPDWLELYQGLL